MTPREKLNEIVANLDGVTPGPWSVNEDETYCGGPCTEDGCPGHGIGRGTSVDGPNLVDWWEQGLGESDEEAAESYANACADAAHVARCDPDTLREIAALVAEQDRRIAFNDSQGTARAQELIKALRENAKLHTRIAKQDAEIARLRAAEGWRYDLNAAPEGDVVDVAAVIANGVGQFVCRTYKQEDGQFSIFVGGSARAYAWRPVTLPPPPPLPEGEE